MTGATGHWRRMAAYNTAANRILYDAVTRLPDEEYRRPRPAFFGSIHGTLNHILLGDLIWMARFEDGSHPSTGLDAILHDDFAALRSARATMDARIEAFVDQRVDDSFLAGAIRYVSNAGLEAEDPVAVLLPHFFNHQTHHRGQVHGLLSQTAVPPPSLDLHRVLRPL